MVYTASEMAKLRGIGCMKKAGMSVKDIRQYIEMALQGDDTIDLCLSLFEHQRGSHEAADGRITARDGKGGLQTLVLRNSESGGHGQRAAEDGAFGCAGALSENSGRASDRTGQNYKVKDKAGAKRYDR